MESGSPELFQRIEEELEDLNQAAEEVNKLEVLLEEVKENFCKAVQSATYTKNSLKKRLGGCVEKARPYYEAKEEELTILDDKEDAARSLARAKITVDRAREEVDQIEGEVLEEKRGFSREHQKRLNEATIKLDESIEEMNKCEEKWKDLEMKHDELKRNLSRLQHRQKNNIKKATEYFECCDDLDCTLRCWKSKVDILQININEAKEKYKTAMTKLEQISNSVHQTRQSESRKEVWQEDEDNRLGYEEIDAKLPPTRVELLNVSHEDEAEDRYPSLQSECRGQSLILYANYDPLERTSLCMDDEGDTQLRKDLRAILDRFLTVGELENLEERLDLERNDDLQDSGLDGEEKGQ